MCGFEATDRRRRAAQLRLGTIVLALALAWPGCGGGGGSGEDAATPPPPPETLTLAPGNGRVTATWSAVEEATSYNLYWSPTAGVSTAGNRVSGAGSPHAVTGLANGVPVYVAVSSVNTAGEGSLSAERSATPLAPPPTSAWASRGIGGGGALFAPSISPFDPRVAYMTTDMSSVFRTEDFGRHWATLDFRQLQGGWNSEVRFTSEPSVLYAVNVLDELGYGIPVKSTDSGRTWFPLATDPTGDGEVYRLFADPHRTNRLVAARNDTVYYSGDGGATFREIHDAGEDDLVAGVFWDGDDIFVATQAGLLVSNDGGSSFARASLGGIPSREQIYSFAGAKENGVVRFFVVTLQEVWSGWMGADDRRSFGGVYRLEGGQAAWVRTTNGIGSEDRPCLVGMARDDVDVAYVAGGNASTYAPVVFKTTDGGATWTSVFRTPGNQNIATGWCGDGGDEEWWFPEIAWGLAVCPTDPDRAILTDFGCAHVTENGGTTWRQAYVDAAHENPAGRPTPRGRAYAGVGLQQTSAWWIHWCDARTLAAAFTDVNGMRSVDGGETWVSGAHLGLPEDNTYHIVGHPTTGALYAATSSVHDIYVSSAFMEDAQIDSGTGSIVWSTDQGQSWQMLHDFGHPVIWLAFDPSDANTLYASVVHSTQGGIHVTKDLQNQGASTWTRLSAPPRTEGHPYNVRVLSDGTLLATYSARLDPNGNFTESSGAFVSTDGGTTWLDRSATGMRRWTKDIVVDLRDGSESTWFACVCSHWGSPPNDVGGLYRTTNRGVDWTRVTDLRRVESAALHPTDPDVLYLATEVQGLWRCGDLTSASPTFQEVQDYPFRHPMRIFFHPSDPQEIWVTNFGGGLRVRGAD